jgi:uncharacterized membrane protein YphA (DoxX/SURF4 family)
VRLLGALADPGRPSWAGLVLRLGLGGLFAQAGLGKFVSHDRYVERFERWGFGGAAAEAAILVGAVEVACGLMLALGVVPRAAALVLIGNMAGALATAGRVDGGRDAWLPAVLIAALAAVPAAGAGRWSLARAARGRVA